ncbi:aldo/keto reductase [Kumtagia ephedrae]|uniref:Aldo/keto reductase n=1 Tax=Kumtagia ephedrae TaxID=2116701 RepID=A0A2P7SAS2_9HYPH|nr:aldo/keto reductase [Mesorhizobium ephedrae]PSJ59586.1 aldo/keto reductase [Mesorhizobium ephedrae]
MSVSARKIGSSDVAAGPIGLGTWAMGGWMWGGQDDARSLEAISASLDGGATLIDTAPAYGLGRAEEIVGQAVKGRRGEVLIATKCGLNWHHGKGNHFFDELGRKVHRYLGRDGILHEIDESLRRLQTDYIDLYITHWQDPTTPVAETMETLLDLKKAGKIRAIGVSNVTPEDLNAYLTVGPVDAIQERYSMLDREIERTLLPICRANNVSTLSYSSLALGLLTGRIGPERVFEGDDLRKDNPRFSVANRARVAGFAAAVEPIARKHGASVAQLVIAWTIAQPGITYALCGARDARQARENAAAGTLPLSASELTEIDRAVATHLASVDA